MITNILTGESIGAIRKPVNTHLVVVPRSNPETVGVTIITQAARYIDIL